MCIIIYAPSNVSIPAAHLRESVYQNPDGFGWAIITGDDIMVHRTMNHKEAVDTFLENREKHPEYPAVFHARIATHGTVDLNNCHPFYVDGKTVLVHNGMLPIKEEAGKSDSHLFATEWLPTLGVHNLDDPDFVKDIEHFASGSKLVVLSASTALARWSYILNEKAGEWDDGVWYSNYSYLPWSYNSYRGGGGYAFKSYSTAYAPSETRGTQLLSGRLPLMASEYTRKKIWVECEFCNCYVPTEMDDPTCPDCGQCTTCQRWDCNCVSDVDEERADLLFSDPESWYIDNDDNLVVWDELSESWSFATPSEVALFQAVYGRVLEAPDSFNVRTESVLDRIVNPTTV